MACKKYIFNNETKDLIYKTTNRKECAYDTKGRPKPGQCRTITDTYKCTENTYINKKGKQQKYECKSGKYNGEQAWFDNCCICATSKKGGYLDLSLQEAMNLKKQLSGETSIPTQIIYGGSKAEIVKINKADNTLEILSDNNIHNISLYAISVNGKHIL